MIFQVTHVVLLRVQWCFAQISHIVRDILLQITAAFSNLADNTVYILMWG